MQPCGSKTGTDVLLTARMGRWSVVTGLTMGDDAQVLYPTQTILLVKTRSSMNYKEIKSAWKAPISSGTLPDLDTIIDNNDKYCRILQGGQFSPAMAVGLILFT